MTVKITLRKYIWEEAHVFIPIVFFGSNSDPTPPVGCMDRLKLLRREKKALVRGKENYVIAWVGAQ